MDLNDVIEDVQKLINYVDDLCETYRDINYDTSKDFDSIRLSLMFIKSKLEKKNV